MSRRKIVQIDEELCTGCGNCVSPCAEGAIEIVNGKARVIREELCDGAGFCIGLCPTGALSIKERDAEEFNEEAVEEHKREREARKSAGAHGESEIFCFRCKSGEADLPLLPIRRQGKSEWVCVRCLPALIHGE